MIRKFSMIVLVLAAVLLAIPLVSAVPGAEKNNERFLSLEINKVSGPPVGPIVEIKHPAPPAETQFRRVIIPEGLIYAEIIINGGTTYVLGIHFTYKSTLEMDVHLNSDPVFCSLKVEQVYTFKPASGIAGSLEVLTEGKFWPKGIDGSSPPYSYGSSIGHGTGVLEGVQLKATGWHLPTGVIHHEGYVTSWPGIP